MNTLEQLLSQLITLLSDEELYRIRHRANKRDLIGLADLVNGEIRKREAQQ